MPIYWEHTEDTATHDVGGYPSSVPEEIPREKWSEWDKMRIGDFVVPGHVVVVSKKEKKADVISVAGGDGATINHLGVEPVELDITITIWTLSQLVSLDQLVASITPKAFPPPPPQAAPGTLPAKPTSASSFRVEHPPLNMLGVTEIYIYEIGSLIPGPVYGSKVTVWRAKERKPDQQILIQPSNASYASQLHPSPPKTPAPTQPVAKPSATAVGP